MLVRLPVRFYDLFDKISQRVEGYRPGVKYCTLCREKADVFFISHSDYNAPKKKKKENGKLYPVKFNIIKAGRLKIRTIREIHIYEIRWFDSVGKSNLKLHYINRYL